MAKGNGRGPAHLATVDAPSTSGRDGRQPKCASTTFAGGLLIAWQARSRNGLLNFPSPSKLAPSQPPRCRFAHRVRAVRLDRWASPGRREPLGTFAFFLLVMALRMAGRRAPRPPHSRLRLLHPLFASPLVAAICASACSHPCWARPDSNRAVHSSRRISQRRRPGSTPSPTLLSAYRASSCCAALITPTKHCHYASLPCRLARAQAPA